MNEALSAFELLEGDFNAVGLKKIQNQLFSMKIDIKRDMDAGLDPDSFAKYKQLLSAIETAEETVILLHEKMVGGK